MLALACATGAAPLAAAPVSIVATQPLSFGKFVAAAGSVSVSPSGTRVTTGGVILLDSGPGQAAQFVVSGDASLTYAVTLPADGTVSMLQGADSMPVNGFVSSPAATGILSPGGSQILNVGARLDVSAGKPAGEYSGSFVVIVEYN